MPNMLSFPVLYHFLLIFHHLSALTSVLEMCDDSLVACGADALRSLSSSSQSKTYGSGEKAWGITPNLLAI
jgi:hypothetical protein